MHILIEKSPLFQNIFVFNNFPNHNSNSNFIILFPILYWRLDCCKVFSLNVFIHFITRPNIVAYYIWFSLYIILKLSKLFTWFLFEFWIFFNLWDEFFLFILPWWAFSDSWLWCWCPSQTRSAFSAWEAPVCRRDCRSFPFLWRWPLCQSWSSTWGWNRCGARQSSGWPRAGQPWWRTWRPGRKFWSFACERIGRFPSGAACWARPSQRTREAFREGCARTWPRRILFRSLGSSWGLGGCRWCWLRTDLKIKTHSKKYFVIFLELFRPKKIFFWFLYQNV